MLKTGQGFSKVYAKSHADSSYYNIPMMGGQSATDLTAEPDPQGASSAMKNMGRGSSVGAVGVAGGRRSRPMTAKVRM